MSRIGASINNFPRKAVQQGLPGLLIFPRGLLAHQHLSRFWLPPHCLTRSTMIATTIDLPGPYAAASELFAALQEIADTPKREESGSSDRQSGQDPEPDIEAAIDHGTTARLDALIDRARAAIALASIPSIPRFTVFCQEAGGSGTIHIDTHEAADLESAIITGKQRCIDDWSSGYKGGESPWNMASVHCLGVAAGDVDILHWSDQPQ